MIFRHCVTCVLVAAAAQATAIWTYTGPVMTFVNGNPALKPAGLSDHFTITITLSSNPRPGVEYTPGFDTGGWTASDNGQPIDVSVAWSDGSVHIDLATSGWLGAENQIGDSVGSVRLAGSAGDGAAGTLWVLAGSGGDSILLCNGDPTVLCAGGPSATYFARSAGGAQGSWTVAQVPEPHNIILAGSALFCLWAIPRARQSDQVKPPRVVAELIRRFR